MLQAVKKRGPPSGAAAFLWLHQKLLKSRVRAPAGVAQ